MLYVVTATQALGVFFRDLVIGARQIDRPDDAPVNVNDIGSIIGHSISQLLHQTAALLMRMPEIEASEELPVNRVENERQHDRPRCWSTGTVGRLCFRTASWGAKNG